MSYDGAQLLKDNGLDVTKLIRDGISVSMLFTLLMTMIFLSKSKIVVMKLISTSVFIVLYCTYCSANM